MILLEWWQHSNYCRHNRCFFEEVLDRMVHMRRKMIKLLSKRAEFTGYVQLKGCDPGTGRPSKEGALSLHSNSLTML